MSNDGIEIRLSRDPVQAMFFVGTVLGAILAVFFLPARSPSTVGTFPTWLSVVFYANIGIWAVVGLWGMLTKLPRQLNPSTYRFLTRQLWLERIGCYGVGWNCWSFAAAAIGVNGWHGFSSATWLFCVGLGLGIRIRYIHVDLAKLREFYRSLVNEYLQSVDDTGAEGDGSGEAAPS
ncbi:hypothetical protein LQ327_09075 [Actinomycetospora endophytica]|uniref:Uncharacterized protein n=1 Tax=Actinomycetospora endophytica TaxID=2291215 RepID=A0ABS8P5X7_9PSEU|nr:hypothetical protein [Actinomycetospora endophytica]MCD2193534.1 hypothetical protein [Actinomycetospora endophytica]